MNKAPKLLISGSIAIDRIMNFAGNYKDLIKPEKIHVLSISVFLKELKNTRGGVGANIAYTLALLGERPTLLGSVGVDASSYVKDLGKMGIDVSHIHFSKLPTASFNVITDLQDNQVGGFYPGAMFDNKKINLSTWKGKNIFVVVSPDDPKVMHKVIKDCIKYKFKYFYDIGQQVSNTSVEDLKFGVKHATVLIVNDYEMSVLCEKIGYTPEKLKSEIPVCITTLGEKGCVIEGSSITKAIRVKSAKAKKIIDPTGAGDAFRAGFLYGYVRGWDLELCAQMGATSAVYAVEKQGTQEHAFNSREFEKRYKENFKNVLKLKS